jgi:hypothetical protein
MGKSDEEIAEGRLALIPSAGAFDSAACGGAVVVCAMMLN